MPSSVIRRTVAAGFPAELLIPICPVTASSSFFKEAANLGKVPARYVPNVDGKFLPLPDWRSGTTTEQLMIADEHGANAGLLLGKPAENYQFVALDIDIEDSPSAVKVCNYIVELVQSYLNKPFWVRKTWPYRASIIFEIPACESTGRKSGYNIFRVLDGKKERILKLEFLTNGQQTVIGGTHLSGNPIIWHQSDDTAVSQEFLSRNELLPKLGTCEIIFTILDLVASKFSDVANTEVIRFGKGSLSSQQSRSDWTQAPDIAPPSLGVFVDFLEKLSHGDEVGRDGSYSYPNVMLACVGCVRGMARDRKITPEQRVIAEHAAISWAAKWEPSDGRSTTWSDEEDKYHSDWNQRPEIHLGWDFLEGLGIERGIYSEADVRRFASERAQDAFMGEDEPPPPPDPIRDAALQKDPEDEDKNVGKRPKLSHYKDANGQILIQAPKSDFELREYIAEQLMGRIHYVTDEKRWIAWNGRGAGWSTPSADAFVREEIFDIIRHYAGQKAGGWTDSDRSKLMSVSRVDAVERLLRSKLNLRSDDLNQNVGFLQTPKGTYDLSTGERISIVDQAAQLDTRLTTVAPEEGPTPLFDELLSMLTNNCAETAEWFLSFLGYTLTGLPKQHVFLLMYGPGGNGKSLLGELVRWILGDYAVQLDRKVLLESGRGEHMTGIAQIKGARFIHVDEIHQGEKWNEATLRAITGSSTVNARKMQQDMTTIKIEGAMLVTTNFIPALYRVDDAIARRIRIINAFKKPLVPNFNLAKELQGEGPAILFKMMRYAKNYMLSNILPSISGAMESETSRYFREMDIFYSWFKECCEVDNQHEIAFDRVCASFNSYGHGTSDALEVDIAEQITAREHVSEGTILKQLKRFGVQVDAPDGKRLTLSISGKKTQIVRGIRIK